MAWGYWSATSVLPDRGRSPRRQATASVPVSTTPAGPGLNSVGGENGAGVAVTTLPLPGSARAEVLSRRSSLNVGISEPGGALAVVLCGGSGHTSRANYVERGNSNPGNKFEFRHQEHCQLHQPALVECHHELSGSEDEDTDPGYATGTSHFVSKTARRLGNMSCCLFPYRVVVGYESERCGLCLSICLQGPRAELG